MGALIRPTEQGRHQKCQGRNHRLMLPEFLEFRPADPGVARFAQLVKEGNRDRRTARPVSRLARRFFRFLRFRQSDELPLRGLRLFFRFPRLGRSRLERRLIRNPQTLLFVVSIDPVFYRLVLFARRGNFERVARIFSSHYIASMSSVPCVSSFFLALVALQPLNQSIDPLHLCVEPLADRTDPVAYRQRQEYARAIQGDDGEGDDRDGQVSVHGFFLIRGTPQPSR